MKGLKIVFFFVALFILIRSIHFSEFLNFSFDQAWISTRALEIWKNKEFTLVGPGSSLVVHGKQVLQGSINYYFHLFFLLLGGFDPIKSSYFLTLFVGLMLIPLFYGVKLLYDKKTAVFISLLYALLPYYIDFSRFFFGPVYQLSLIPILVLFMGLYKKYKKSLYLFFVFIVMGILTQFHYQTLIVLFLLSIYYLWKTKNKTKIILIMLGGFTLGFLPIIIFEFKNNFYNLKVLWEYLRFVKKPSDFFFIPHRFLSISLVVLIIMATLYRKFLSNKILIALGLALFTLDLFIYLPRPKNAFGMSTNWNYLMEKKAFEIIKKENLQDFNIVNHIYDNKSVVIKYHLKLNNYHIDYDDYYHNKYLFVISKTAGIFDDPAYEINTFQPNKKLKQWKLNNKYNLYLFQRIKEKII